MRKIYNDNICKLCDKNIVDDRDYWRVCVFLEEEWNNLYTEISEVIKENKRTNVKLWFGKDSEVNYNADNLDLAITIYNKTASNAFFIPNNAEKYLKSKEIKKTKNTLYQINYVHAREAYKIYKKRCKEHTKVIQIDDIKDNSKRKRNYLKRT